MSAAHRHTQSTALSASSVRPSPCPAPPGPTSPPTHPPLRARARHLQGYRFPAPGSQASARIPDTEDEDRRYDIKYFTRNVRRQGHLDEKGRSTRFADRQIAQANALVVTDGDEPPIGSPGTHYTLPAVQAYDPTGLRSAMTANHEETYKAVQAHLADHNVYPAWRDRTEEIAALTTGKGLPVSGRMKEMRAPRSLARRVRRGPMPTPPPPPPLLLAAGAWLRLRRQHCPGEQDRRVVMRIIPRRNAAGRRVAEARRPFLATPRRLLSDSRGGRCGERWARVRPPRGAGGVAHAAMGCDASHVGAWCRVRHSVLYALEAVFGGVVVIVTTCHRRVHGPFQLSSIPEFTNVRRAMSKTAGTKKFRPERRCGQHPNINLSIITSSTFTMRVLVLALALLAPAAAFLPSRGFSRAAPIRASRRTVLKAAEGECGTGLWLGAIAFWGPPTPRTSG